MMAKSISREGVVEQQESRAIYLALMASLITFIVAFLTFGEQTALYGRGSIGFRAAIAVAIVAFIVFYARRQRTTVTASSKKVPRRRSQKLGRIAEDLSLALVYGITGFLLTIGAFYVINNGFVGVTLDALSAAVLVALCVGVAAYGVYLLVQNLSSIQLSSVLGMFLVSGALASMMTASDPQWWERHFSALGAGGGISGYAFNGTLVLAGLVIAALAGFISNDFARIQARGEQFRDVKVALIRTTLVLIGIFLALVGLFVYDAYPLIHNSAAGGMAVLFVGLVLALPWVAPGLSRAFFVFSYSLMAGILVSYWLFVGIGYFNLTVFELICVAIIFGWMIVFIRQIAAHDSDDSA